MDEHLMQRIQVQIKYNQSLESIHKSHRLVWGEVFYEEDFILVIVEVHGQEQVRHDKDE
jgi:hypothetical protein